MSREVNSMEKRKGLITEGGLIGPCEGRRRAEGHFPSFSRISDCISRNCFYSSRLCHNSQWDLSNGGEEKAEEEKDNFSRQR